MDVKQLEYFVALAEEGSVSKAAHRFFISQSALSQHLTKLELQMNVSLFDRTKQGLSLTAAGQVYYNGAKKMLSVYADTCKNIQALKRTNTNPLTLATATGRGTALFANIYPQFHRDHPDINISLKECPSGEAEQMVINGTADYALTVLTGAELSDQMPFEYKVLSQEELILVVSPSHALFKQIHVSNNTPSLQDFAKEPFVLPSSQTKMRHMIDEYFHTRGFSPNIAFETSNAVNILHVINESNLCSVVSTGFVSKDHAYHTVPLDVPPRLAFCICWKRNRVLTETDKAFIDLCQQYIDKNWLSK